MKDIFQDSNDRLLQILPKEEAEKIFAQDECDIEPVFLGFVHIYESLSNIIPHHWTVVDFGCAYNPQSYFFTKHKKYIAVDISPCEKFKPDNCDLYLCSVGEWIKENIKNVKQSETFAICSYVPNWGEGTVDLVRQNFKNVFTYYPHGGYQPVVNVVQERKPVTKNKLKIKSNVVCRSKSKD